MNKDYYSYNNIDTGNAFKISPSSFSGLLISAGDWYQSQVKKNSSFTGNRKTVLGTLIHARIHMYYEGVQYSTDEEAEYVASHNLTQEDHEYIFSNIETMWTATLSDYIMQYPTPTTVEEEVKFLFNWSNDSMIAGSVDAFEGSTSTVIDYKTTDKKPPSMRIEHFIQGLIYALAYKSKGIHVKNVRIVNIVAKTKTLPARVFIFEEPVTQDHYNWIDHQMRIAQKKMDLVKKDLSLQDVVFTPDPSSYYNKDGFNAMKRSEPSSIQFANTKGLDLL